MMDGYRMLVRFLEVIYSFNRGKPLILFLDNLHWADQPSLDLLTKLVKKMLFLFLPPIYSKCISHHHIQLCKPASAEGYLLLIGGCRDQGVKRGHPLKMFLNDIQVLLRNTQLVSC